MAVTVSTFLESFPEFAGTDATLIGRKLIDAAAQVPGSVWGAKQDQGIELTAAHMLALSPFGEPGRLVDDDGTTIYEKRLRTMQVQVAGGARVL